MPGADARPMPPLAITAYTLVNALGHGVAASRDALLEKRGGLRGCDFEDAELDTWIGRVDGIEQAPLLGRWADYECRNNRLVRLGLETDDFARAVQLARDRYGADRIGLFLGTSTSGIRATEIAYRERASADGALPEGLRLRYSHNTYSLVDFARRYLGLHGPAAAVSTACSSSAKVFALASRHMRAGFCDAAVVGGVDTLCLTTLYGFNSLELVSSEPCRPWDAARDGVNIGEAAGFALLESSSSETRLALLGYGESSDAYHMSTPHPNGTGAQLAMRGALTSAGITPEDVDYVNLHGTATPSNDASEDRAILSVFDEGPACSSTKGWTGHTLGAAGITEALFSLLCVEHGFIPASLNTREQDPGLHADIVMQTRRQPVDIVMSNSFGFGGTNCSLVLGRPR